MEYTAVIEHIIDTLTGEADFNFIKLYRKEIPRKHLGVEIITKMICGVIPRS